MTVFKKCSMDLFYIIIVYFLIFKQGNLRKKLLTLPTIDSYNNLNNILSTIYH